MFSYIRDEDYNKIINLIFWISEILNNTYKIEGIIRIINEGLFKKYEHQKRLEHRSLSEFYSMHKKNTKTTKKKNNIKYKPSFAYSRLEGFRELDEYKISYAYRYSNKKGLAKWDCYCEKKIFNILDSMNDTTAKSHNSKSKNFKRLVNKVLVCLAIIPCVLPLFGLILPVLDMIKHSDSCNSSLLRNIEITKTRYIVYCVLFLIMTYIIVVTIIYVVTKIVKYESLKNNKGKMNFKKYCIFCRELILNK
ncbi:variable surface protein [Plasmodium gonderi]|uniref:Variable surface protein n=1 Tax=Plasmodium gonderi TaxID=77519 RepID=A0A1Y1JC66_PLAGO|nr:variable surface protein [Plasmodium gonderi]GAW80086.1 variable surface protein [Plasmodium gonderi]